MREPSWPESGGFGAVFEGKSDGAANNACCSNTLYIIDEFEYRNGGEEAESERVKGCVDYGA